jgi:hypothetical protein
MRTRFLFVFGIETLKSLGKKNIWKVTNFQASFFDEMIYN